AWGVFAPAYAVHSSRGLGMGDTGDLAALAGWVGRARGQLYGTTPMLASLDDEPFDPSPYAPATRLLWNELFIDFSNIPAAAAGPVQELIGSSALSEARTSLNQPADIDYAPIVTLHRRLLERLSTDFHAQETP